MATVAGERVFLRRASGLIKTASNSDVFIYDIGLVSIGLGLGFLLFFGPAVYLGGNLYIGTLLAGAAMVLVGLGMICWTITIPRSGGIYNFGTRSMWPPLAFTLSFVEVSAWLFYGSFGAVYLAQLGIAPMVTTIGIITDSPGVESFGADLAGKWGTFAIASGALIIGAIILASGMRRFFFTQKVMFTIAVVGTLIFRTMGSDFLGSVTYSSLNAVEGASTPVTPFPTLLTGLGSDSVILTILLSLGFIGWIWLWIPTQILYPTRAIVAWSLDRVGPDVLGTVNDRTHTPIPAILLSLAGGITFVGMLAFTSFFQLVIFIEVAVLAWAIVLLAGVFFPYRRPDIYNKSPISNIRIAGIPVMSVACGLGSIAATLFFFNLFFDDFAAGHARHSLSVLIGWFVGAFVLYWIMWIIRRRQGVKVELAFKEIPIE